MKTFLSIFYFIILYVIASITSLVALFIQTTEYLKNGSFYTKLLYSEFFASIQWAFAIPAFRIGYEYLTAPQLFLLGYLIGFVVQILMYIFWLNVSVNIDTYITMILMVIALFVAKFKTFG